MAHVVLECTSFPSDLKNREPEELLDVYRKVEGLKCTQNSFNGSSKSIHWRN